MDSYVHRLPLPASPTFSKTAREWILSSALYDGIEDEDIRQIETLLAERGANPNVLLPEYGITPFHLVVANESTRFAVKATDICLQHGADPNVRSEDGLTPVHLAAMWGCAEVLHVLLASGGNPWLVDCFKLNAFDYAQKECQQECYSILNMYCSSEPKPSNQSKSPYQLNLKRVILYKNDLQIVYEASPPSSRRNTSTQTSPSALKNTPVMNGLTDFAGNFNGSNGEQTRKPNSPKKDKQNGLGNLKTEQRKNLFNKNHSEESKSCTTISSGIKEVIINHRKNSSIFEYSPSKEDVSTSSGVVSWRDETSKNSEETNRVSELIGKLELTNQVRQSLKSNFDQNSMLKNVTHRKKPCPVVKAADSSFKEESLSDIWNSCESSLPQNEIGFVFNNSQVSSASSIPKQIPHANIESPPSIGFILDNLDKTVSRSRGSSLFSDISSNVGANLSTEKSVQANNDITEDENSPEERHLTKYSSTDSLYPYVSCDSGHTRECESGEYFESCLEKVASKVSTPGSLHSTLPSDTAADFALANTSGVHTTPVNPKLVSSTPEKLSSECEMSFSSAVDQSGLKKGWVEAKVSSSSDEDPYMSISEEYEYTDLDEGVVLIEKRYLLNDINVSSSVKKKEGSKTVQSSGSEISETSSISGSERAYDTDELRQALQSHGVTVGPINGHTKRIYLRKLKRCRRKPQPLPPMGLPAYSPELLKTLESDCEHLLYEWAHLEDSMSASFTCGRRTWREGLAKTSFTYLLLDPCLSQNLPALALSNPHATLWPQFLRAVFYVGKGKRSRPYAHLYQAVSVWQQQKNSTSKKIQRILDIWNSGQGVVCLHVFLNIIPVEAFTREASMISALTLPELSNEKTGEFYGSAASWSQRLKRRLGCVLLHRAYKVFIAEGERQLRPADIE